MAERYSGSYLDRCYGWRAVAILADIGPASLVERIPSGDLSCCALVSNHAQSVSSFEDIATVEVTVVVEVVVDRGMGSGELLESFHVRRSDSG
jgi:hypothetical protein